jgi:hypothetical protein
MVDVKGIISPDVKGIIAPNNLNCMTERSKEDTERASPCSLASPGIGIFAGREGRTRQNKAKKGKSRQKKAKRIIRSSTLLFSISR